MSIVSGFTSSNGNFNCNPIDETEFYAFYGGAAEMNQYYFRDASIGDLVFGHRTVDAIDVDIINQHVYFLDDSLKHFKVRQQPPQLVTSRFGCCVLRIWCSC